MSGSAYYIGDSIAVGAAIHAGSKATKANPVNNSKGGTLKALKGDAIGTNQAVGGTPPVGVLYYVQQHAKNLRGSHVVISTGASNSGDVFKGSLQGDLATIEKQLQTLKEAGATVTVMGVANDFKLSNKYGTAPKGTGEKINKQLQQLASKYGFEFAGGFKSSDGVHSYSGYSVSKKYKSAGAIGNGGGAKSQGQPTSSDTSSTPTTSTSSQPSSIVTTSPTTAVGQIPDLNFTNQQPVTTPYVANPFATIDALSGPVMYNGVGLVQSSNPFTQNLFGEMLNSGYNSSQEPALVNAAQGVGGAMQSLFG